MVLLPPRPSRKKNNGFTLIEVLIALVILAIALTAVVKSILDNTQAASYLQNKTMAHWVGMEVISEAQLGLLPLPDEGDSSSGSITLFNQHWPWFAKFKATPDTGVKELDVTVKMHDNNQVLAKLTGYVTVTKVEK